jgi:hypothetical protein
MKIAATGQPQLARIFFEGQKTCIHRFDSRCSSFSLIKVMSSSEVTNQDGVTSGRATAVNELLTVA